VDSRIWLERARIVAKRGLGGHVKAAMKGSFGQKIAKELVVVSGFAGARVLSPT
jgi:hypothetical protein